MLLCYAISDAMDGLEFRAAPDRCPLSLSHPGAAFVSPPSDHLRGRKFRDSNEILRR